MTGVQRKKGVGARTLVAPTKSDSTDDPAGISRGIYIDGTQGIVKFNDAKGTTLTLNNMQVGIEYDFAISRVWNSITTATNIYLLY